MVKKKETSVEKQGKNILVAPPKDDETAETTVVPNKDPVVFMPPPDNASAQAAVAPTQSVSAFLHSLIGKPLPEVRAELQKLKDDHKIVEFKVVPMGQPLSTELVRGRVSIIKDHLNNVIDIVVG